MWFKKLRLLCGLKDCDYNVVKKTAIIMWLRKLRLLLGDFCYHFPS
jgi:hypothetical protein